jgi:Tfp pilus assembly protein PilP
MMRKLAAALASIVLLASCHPEPGDLRKELRELSANQLGKVNPLPALRPQQEPAYTAGNLPDPFYPDLRPDRLRGNRP